MSEPIVRSPSEQSQNPAPDQASEPQATVQDGASAAAEQASKQDEQMRDEAAQTRKSCVREFRQGERAYRAGLLEAGRLGDLYIHQRMALSDKRAAAVLTLEGDLSAHSSTPVDLNRLIASWHAYRLLALEPGLTGEPRKPGPADAVPYGAYRNSWSQLVERHDKDKPGEHWVLLPGMEQEARDLFAKASADQLSMSAAQEQVKAIMRLYADRQAEQAALARNAAIEEAKRTAAEQKLATDEAQRAEHLAAQARAAEQTAKEEDRARLAEDTMKAEEELRAKQQAAIAAQATAEAAAREKNRKDREATAAEAAQKRALEKAQKAAERGQQKPRNLLASDKSDAAAIAALAAECVTDCDCPDDVFALLLRRLKDSGEMSKQSLRAIDAALLVLSRAERRPEPSTNGKPEPVAA